uniref:SWIM-type domain-containing protein n=1 Tax=Kalanchoe fedtschenkoi TaxID=63787 RepID=A0A7N0T3E6_KALFE
MTNTQGQNTLILGRKFSSKDEVYDFYNHYALYHGFGIRINGHTKSRTSKEIIRWQFVCNKEGLKLKDKRQLGKDVKSYREMRTGCKAKMEISLKSDEWVVDKFEDEHNHSPTTPSKVMKHRYHNKFHRTPVVKNQCTSLTKKLLMPLAVVTKWTLLQNNVQIYYGQRKKIIRNQMGVHYFAIDLASDGSLKSVFWADGRFRLAYAQFEDVLVFDVTYRTNHFNLPFAPFVEHLHSLCARFDDFGETYTNWQKRNTIEEFELDWEIIKQKYSIAKGRWLDNMYNLRVFWVKVYLKDCFTAGVTTSGRSESMNSYFDGYVNSNTMLNDFVKQYDKAVEARRIKEEEEDFRTIESHAVSLTNYPVEEHVARLYTRNLFEIFKLEWKKSFDYIHKKSNKGFNFVECLVGKYGLDVKYWRLVNYKSDKDLSLKCTCCKFEMEGILCKHILYIVRKKNLEVIPNQYFLPRWTIGARYKNNMANNSSSSNRQAGTGASPLTIWSIQRKFSMILEIGRKSSSDLQLLESVLDTYIERWEIRRLLIMLKKMVNVKAMQMHHLFLRMINVR